MLIEGNTEDGVEPETEDEEEERSNLFASLIERQSLTVKAKKQPLSLVLAQDR